MKYSKSSIENYSQPLSDSEKKQCENAIDMVKGALENYGYKISVSKKNYSDDGYALYYEMRDNNYGSVTILVQGSYGNNTNIKRYSDVDVSVIYKSILPISLESSFFFKTDIYNALYKKFGSDVTRKNKSINVNGNTYRKSIDVVPAYAISTDLKEGIEFLTEKDIKIRNYPISQIINENFKNKLTNYMFKKYVRILKNIKKDMEELNYTSASKIGSFQVESLLWNLDNKVFTRYFNLGYGVEEIINTLKNNINSLQFYYESNGIKKLCQDIEMRKSIENFIIELSTFYRYEM